MPKAVTRRAVRKVLDEMDVPTVIDRRVLRKAMSYEDRFDPPIRGEPTHGGPTIYTDEIANEICLRIAGGESLRKICQDPRFPSRHTIVSWKNEKPDFRAKYAEARQDQADVYAEMGLEVATGATTAGEAIAARLAFDAYRWAAGKLKPGTYGDKVQHANAAGDGNVVTEIVYRWATEPKAPE